MSKHTPGPWKFLPSSGTPAVEVGRTIWGVCWIPGTDDIVLEPEFEATARLIAAAPDLLAALKALVEADGECWCSVNHDRDAGPLGSCELHGALDAARAAVAKAEGEAQGAEVPPE